MAISLRNRSAAWQSLPEFGLLVSAGSDFHGPGGWSEIGQYRPVPEDLPPLWCRFKHDTDIAAV